MSKPYSLIVTDTSPLITLALADSLDALLRPGLTVHIPDAVYTEAIRIRDAPASGRPLLSRCGRDCDKLHKVDGDTAMTEVETTALLKRYSEAGYRRSSCGAPLTKPPLPTGSLNSPSAICLCRARRRRAASRRIAAARALLFPKAA